MIPRRERRGGWCTSIRRHLRSSSASFARTEFFKHWDNWDCWLRSRAHSWYFLCCATSFEEKHKHPRAFVICFELRGCSRNHWTRLQPDELDRWTQAWRSKEPLPLAHLVARPSREACGTWKRPCRAPPAVQAEDLQRDGFCPLCLYAFLRKLRFRAVAEHLQGARPFLSIHSLTGSLRRNVAVDQNHTIASVCSCQPRPLVELLSHSGHLAKQSPYNGYSEEG